MAKIILITGGARSGKSGYAQRLAEGQAGSRAYIATCPSADRLQDQELRSRIERHQRQRSAGDWVTMEETVALADLLAAAPHFDFLLVDCLTLWINNFMVQDKPDLTEEELAGEVEKLLTNARGRSGTVIFVTNEVGGGIVPENKLARRFRDLAGRCNQLMAAGADEVIFMVAGLSMKIKGD